MIKCILSYRQGVSCDRFLGRTHAPRTSRLRCACTRERTPNFKRSHFAPAPALQSFFINFSNFFQQFFSIFMVQGVQKQNKMIQNRKGRSKAGKDVLKTFFQDKKQHFLASLSQKVCKSVIAHRTSKKGPHARTSRTLSRMDFARTRTRATAQCTCACAHAPSQPIPCYLCNRN